MSEHTPGPCGCALFDNGIIYCPLHNAAPDLLDALRGLEAVTRSIVNRNIAEATKKARAAIEQAGG